MKMIEIGHDTRPSALISRPLAELAVGAFSAAQRARVARDAVERFAHEHPSRVASMQLAESTLEVEMLAELHALAKVLAPYEAILRGWFPELFQPEAAEVMDRAA